jgi:hypothetical protein
MAAPEQRERMAVRYGAPMRTSAFQMAQKSVKLTLSGTPAPRRIY